MDGVNISNMKEEQIAKIRNEKLGFVFQDFMLLDGLNVFENVCVPKVIHQEPYRQMETKAEKLLKMFDIADIAKKFPRRQAVQGTDFFDFRAVAIVSHTDTGYSVALVNGIGLVCGTCSLAADKVQYLYTAQ